MTLEERALEILGQMDITPGRGRQREDNWIAIIADAIRAAQAEQQRKDAEFVKNTYIGGSLIADAILAQEE